MLKVNMFKTKSFLLSHEINKSFEFEINQFPTLVLNDNDVLIDSSDSSDSNELNYKNASLNPILNMEEKDINNKYYLKPGWISYQYKNTRKSNNGLVLIDRSDNCIINDYEIIENNIDIKTENVVEESDGNIILNKLVDNWRIYKENYDLKNGQGEYDIYYKNVDNNNNNDSDYEVEYDYINDDVDVK